MAQPLDQRIKAALGEDSRLADVQAVIAATRSAQADATSARKQADAASVDPLGSTEDCDTAFTQSQRHGRDVDRLASAITMLEARERQIVEDTSFAERRARYDATVAACEAVKQRIVERYPVLVDEFVSIARDLTAAMRAADMVNRDLPRGAARVENPEFAARQTGPGRSTVLENRIVQAVHDPMWSAAWPQPEERGIIPIMPWQVAAQ